jgi:hypothetical protein
MHTAFEGTIPTAPRAKPAPIRLVDDKALRFPSDASRRLQTSLEVRVERQRVREAELMKVARAAGHEDGFRKGYQRGTHWGIFCGVFWGVIGLAVVLGTAVAFGHLHIRLW